jgi:single-strand selective monofunctional uracil DNA glycosylase
MRSAKNHPKVTEHSFGIQPVFKAVSAPQAQCRGKPAKRRITMTSRPELPQALLNEAYKLRDAVNRLSFEPPVAHVYNPLDYALAPYRQYLERYARCPKPKLFLGMNPGPFGMMQTGIPFGEIKAVRQWMGLDATIQMPAHQHPKRLIEGWACKRSEVSGRRLWAWAATTYGSAERFFAEHFVVNFCPLVFLEASGKNRTPESLPSAERGPLDEACMQHLLAVIGLLEPKILVGVGGFAARRLELARQKLRRSEAYRVIQILHPSPASPAANRGWEEAIAQQLSGVDP